MNSVDEKVIKEVLELESDNVPAFLAELIRLLSTAATQNIQTMTDSIIKKDAPTLRKDAHFLKSAAGNIGAKKMAELCRHLEMMGTSGDLVKAQDILDQLKSEYESVKKELDALLAKEKAIFAKKHNVYMNSV